MLAFVLLTSLLLSSQVPGGVCGCEDKPQVNTLAVVNGVKITKQELGASTQTRVSLLQEEVIKARNAQLDLLINNLLLEAEAKRRGVTAARLFELEVSTKVTQPSEDEVEDFYNLHKDQLPGDFKKIKADISALLKADRERAESAKFASMLRGAAVITILVPNVTPPGNEEELNRVFAKVNSRYITSRDIEQSLAPLIYKVQQQVYTLRREDLEIKINDLLLEEEARKENTTPDAIIAREVRGNLPIITDEQAKAFYQQNKSQLHEDFEKVKFQIIELLLRQEQQKLILAYASNLRKNAAVQIYLTPPDPPKNGPQMSRPARVEP